MKTLTVTFSMALTVGLMMVGFRIFSKIHCRQESWHGSFKTITNQFINKKKHKAGVCKDNSTLELSLGETL